MKKYNVGIIGYGWVATAHIPAINASKQAHVTAVYSSRPLDSAELSAKWGGRVAAYNDLKKMLADPSIHAVSICSYPYQHAKQAVTEMTGSPARWKARTRRLMWVNCASRSACRLPSIVLRLACKL